jgi:antitoxin PrlF
MKAIISEKGQITVPKACRDRLGLRPGTVLDFEAVGGKLVGSKRVSEDVFRKWRGKGRLPVGLGVDAYLNRVRG